MISPGGRVEPVIPEPRIATPETRPIGLYAGLEVVAADAREALVAAASSEAVRAAFGLPAPEQAAERTRPGEFWPWLLLALLLLLAIENLLVTGQTSTPHTILQK